MVLARQTCIAISVVLLSSQAFAGLCRDRILHVQQYFAAANENAQRPAHQYTHPHERTLADYNLALSTDKWRVKLQSGLNPWERALDVGSGRGDAMIELTSKTGARADLVNTQNFLSSQSGRFRQQDLTRVRLLLGFAEAVLPQLQNDYKYITDVWGAFSYSPAKAELLQLYFERLQVGGEAYILFPYVLTDSRVIKLNGEVVRLSDYLSELAPENVQVGFSQHPLQVGAHVIRLKKNKNTDTLHLPLRVRRVMQTHWRDRDMLANHTEYEEVPSH